MVDTYISYNKRVVDLTENPKLVGKILRDEEPEMILETVSESEEVTEIKYYIIDRVLFTLIETNMPENTVTMNTDTVRNKEEYLDEEVDQMIEGEENNRFDGLEDLTLRHSEGYKPDRLPVKIKRE